MNQNNNYDLYGAIASAETGPEPDPWIRTKFAPPEGSTAYGPCQLTKSLAQGYLSSGVLSLSDEETVYLKEFIQQGVLFAKFGKEPDKAGYEKKYDYGGRGHLTTPTNKELYKQVVNKMLTEIYDRHEDLEKTWLEWRFGLKAANDPPKFEDERYRKAFYKHLGIKV